MWFIAALVLGIALTALFFILRGKGFKFAWYEVLIALIGIGVLLFGIQNYLGFKAEFEPDAAQKSLVVIGLPGLVILLIAGLLMARRQKTA
jgi:hypothetical protein